MHIKHFSWSLDEADEMLSRALQIAREDSLGEALIRSTQYIRSRLASKWRMREWSHLVAQTELIAKTLKGSFTLIILDACRYDFFQKNYRSVLSGELQRVKSPASHTKAWLKVVFSENARLLRDVRIFSASPYVNSRDVTFDGFRARDYVRERIVDVWDWGWDSKLNHIPPDNVLKAIDDEGMIDRNIVWFGQPHFPYIGKTRLHFPREIIGVGKTATANRFLAKEIESKRLSREKLLRAYEDNLVLVLESVKRLLETVRPEGKTIITSDHGELLGEHGLYAHPSHINLPELRIVPWFEVHS